MKAWWNRFCDNNGELLALLGLAALIIVGLFAWRLGPVILGGMWDALKMTAEICVGWLQIIYQLIRAILGG